MSEYSDVEYVFEPHSSTVPDLREYVTTLVDRWPFIVWLTKSDIRMKRTNRTLGNLWAVLDPLFQAGIYYFIYMVLRGGARAYFLPTLIASMFFYQLSLGALNDGGQSVKRGKNLMLNSTFPRALLPVQSVYSGIRRFLPAIGVILVVYPLIGGAVGPGIFVLPLLFAIQTVLNFGIALLMSTFVVLVPDATNAMRYITRLIFFTTPVIYPVSLLPPGAALVLAFQPLFGMFVCYQTVFTGGMPSIGYVMLAVTWATILVLVGGYLFLRNERRFSTLV